MYVCISMYVCMYGVRARMSVMRICMNDVRIVCSRVTRTHILLISYIIIIKYISSLLLRGAGCPLQLFWASRMVRPK